MTGGLMYGVRRHGLQLLSVWRLALKIRRALNADRAVLVAIVDVRAENYRGMAMNLEGLSIGAGQVETIGAAQQMMIAASTMAGPYAAEDVREVCALLAQCFGLRTGPPPDQRLH